MRACCGDCCLSSACCPVPASCNSGWDAAASCVCCPIANVMKDSCIYCMHIKQQADRISESVTFYSLIGMICQEDIRDI